MRRLCCLALVLSFLLPGCGGSGASNSGLPAYREIAAPAEFFPIAIGNSGGLIGSRFATVTIGGTQYPQSAFGFASGKLTILPTLNGSPQIDATGLNGNDQIVGFCNLEPVVWLQTRRPPEPLPWPAGFPAAQSTGTLLQTEFINNREQVIGNATNGDAQSDTAYLWASPSSVPTVLGPAQFQATGFSNNGIAVGYLDYLTDFEFYKVDVNTNVSTDLGFLGPDTNTHCVINDSGTIALGEYPANATTGFASDLVVISPTGSSSVVLPSAYPVAMNSQGDIVGQQIDAIGGAILNPFLYKPGRAVLNLNNLIPSAEGFSQVFVTGINDQGQVLGSGINGRGRVSFIIQLPAGAY